MKNQLLFGARGTGHVARGKLARRRALEVARLAARLGTARAARVEMYEGRQVSHSTREEFAAIYRAELITALARAGQMVTLQGLFRRRGNPYTFGVRRAYLCALREAARGCSREAHRSLRIADEAASMDDLVRLREWSLGNWGEARGVEVVESPAMAGDNRDRGARAPLSAREVRHARECLVVHWSLSGSGRWRGALAQDLALLRDCVAVARGEGTARIGAWDGPFRQSAARKSLDRLRQRMAAGDLLMTDHPERVEAALSEWAGVREESRAHRRGRQAAEMADYLLLS